MFTLDKIIRPLCVLVLLNSSASAQIDDFSYQDLQELIVNTYERVRLNDLLSERELEKAYDLTRELPEGFVKSGTVDYTRYLQRGLQNHRIVVLPNFPVLVNTAGLDLKDSSTVIFQERSELYMMPNDRESYAVLKIYNRQEITIFCPTIVGDRIFHKGSGGQWGMGISVRGSSNINIIHPSIKNCWGDGIYIGRYEDKCSSKITILSGVLDFNRRNGISIVCGDSVNIAGTIITNTSGNPPMSGIDIEPNNNEDIINNILIDSVITFNNAKRGILINLDRLVGQQKKEVNINISHHTDLRSADGLFLAISKLRKGQPLSGSIEIINPRWIENNKEPFRYYKGPENNLDVTLKGVSIMKKSLNGKRFFAKEELQRIKQNIARYQNITIEP